MPPHIQNMTTMHPSSSLVNVAEQAELSLITLLSSQMRSLEQVNVKAAEEDCENLIAHADAIGFVRRVLLSNDFPALDVLLMVQDKVDGLSGNGGEQQERMSVEDAVSAFALLVALLQRSGSEEDVDAAKAVAEVQSQVAVAIVNACKSDSVGKVNKHAAMGMLKVLFDLTTSPEVNCFLYRNMVQLAVDDASGTLISELAKDRYMFDFKASFFSARQVSILEGIKCKKAKREVFQVVGQALDRCLADAIENGSSITATSSLANERQRVLLLQLDTYDSDADISKDALIAASNVAIGAIRDPIALFSEQRDMLKMPAIVALKKTESGADLYSLLTIFTEGSFEEYQQFLAKASAKGFFASHSVLSEEQCTKNMRLLSLCTLASESKTSSISYDQIASALDISSGDVEEWVIAARACGLIDAKMDQIREVVTVERCVIRNFGIEQWKSLQRKLNMWKVNVKSVPEDLKKNEANLKSNGI